MAEQAITISREGTPHRARALAKNILPYLIAILVAFGVVGILVGALGYDVLQAYSTLLFTSFRTANGFTQTLVKFVPLVLQALAFTIPLASGKFNIGGEGQLIVGAIGATLAGLLLKDLPAPILLPLVLIAGILFGAAWGAIPAWLLYRFSVHEILTTVLLNFVSFQILDLIATGPLRDPVAGHPTSLPIGSGGELPLLLANPPLHSGILLALAVAVGAYIFVTRTTTGYELVATGANPRAAKVFGIDARAISFLALSLGGALAGLSGAIEVAGVQHRLIEGIQSNYLLLGIIIGLIAKGDHRVVPFVAFFIAILEIGASALQRTMALPGEISLIIEALILIFVLLSDVVGRRQ